MRNFITCGLMGMFVLLGSGISPASANAPCAEIYEKAMAQKKTINWGKIKNIEQKVLGELRKAERAKAASNNKACHASVNLAVKKMNKQK